MQQGIHPMRPVLILCLCLLTSLSASAASPSVKVLALFTDKAMVMIDGERHLMKKGQTLNGVTLLSATGRGAEVRLPSGQKKKLGLNQRISTAYRKSAKVKHTVYADPNGMFQLEGKINDRQTRFLLDTGATYVAMSQREADRLGLVYEGNRKSLIQTASEIVPVWNVKLDSVGVGRISIPQVDAVVFQGNHPSTVLLGMSFLQHLNLQRNGASMVLEQKFKQ